MAPSLSIVFLFDPSRLKFYSSSFSLPLQPGDDDLFGDLSDEAVFAPEGDKDDGVAYVAFDDHLMS